MGVAANDRVSPIGRLRRQVPPKRGRIQAEKDVLSSPIDHVDSHARDRVDEYLRLGVANDRGERELATHDGAAGEMRSQVSDDGFDLGKLRHRRSPRQAGLRPLLAHQNA